MGVERIERARSGYTPLTSRETDAVEVEDQQLVAEIAPPRKTFLLLSLANLSIFLLTIVMFYKSQQTPDEKLLNAELRMTSSYSESNTCLLVHNKII